MRLLLTVAAYLLSLAALAPLLFFTVIILAGPHSSLLPPALQSVVVVLSLVTLVMLPIVIARGVWRRADGRKMAAP